MEFAQAWSTVVQAALESGCRELHNALSSKWQGEDARRPLIDLRPQLFGRWDPSEYDHPPSESPSWHDLIPPMGRLGTPQEGATVLIVRLPTKGITSYDTYVGLGPHLYVLEALITAPKQDSPPTLAVVRGALCFEYDASTDPVRVKRSRMRDRSTLSRIQYLVLIQVPDCYDPRPESPPLNRSAENVDLPAPPADQEATRRTASSLPPTPTPDRSSTVSASAPPPPVDPVTVHSRRHRDPLPRAPTDGTLRPALGAPDAIQFKGSERPPSPIYPGASFIFSIPSPTPRGPSRCSLRGRT